MADSICESFRSESQCSGSQNQIPNDEQLLLDESYHGSFSDGNSSRSDSRPRTVDTEGEEEEDLIESMIAEGLSQIGQSADGSMQVFLSLTLRGKGLETAHILMDYIHIQTLDLSFNCLTDVSALSNLPYLITLDLSHNQLSSVLDFTPPLALRDVNLSYNNISDIPDLCCYHCLTKFNLDFNNISEIKGLSACHRLHHFSMTNNNLERISGLEYLPLKHLNLSHNQIKKIEGMQTLTQLQFLDLSHNQIRSLRGLTECEVLYTLLLENNRIIDLAETRYIRDLQFLRILDLRNNPLQTMPDYRISMTFRMPHLTELDGITVVAEEKVKAHNYFNPPMELTVAEDHRRNLILSYQHTVQLFDSTLSSLDTPYPVLVITGPAGSGKRFLVKRLCQEFPNYFGHCLSHTTRSIRTDDSPSKDFEIDGADYIFTSKEDFEQQMKQGTFLQTCQLYGDTYGIARESIECIAREGLACVLHMELEGVMAMKSSYFEPRFVLLLPETRQVHENRLRQRQCYNEPQVLQILARSELYQNFHLEHPGYFDVAICTDDAEEAYDQLKRILLEYLGISPWNSTRSNITISSKASTSIEPVIGGDTRSSGEFNRSNLKSLSKTNLKSPETIQDAKAAVKSPFEAASLERRYKQVKEATTGITSSAEEQLSKVRGPVSAVGIAPSSGHKNLVSPEISKRSSSAPQTLLSNDLSGYPEQSLDEAYESQAKVSEEDSSVTDSEESLRSSANSAHFDGSMTSTPTQSLTPENTTSQQEEDA